MSEFIHWQDATQPFVPFSYKPRVDPTHGINASPSPLHTTICYSSGCQVVYFYLLSKYLTPSLCMVVMSQTTHAPIYHADIVLVFLSCASVPNCVLSANHPFLFIFGFEWPLTSTSVHIYNANTMSSSRFRNSYCCSMTFQNSWIPIVVWFHSPESVHVV